MALKPWRRARRPGMERLRAMALEGLVLLAMAHASNGAVPEVHELRNFNGSHNNPDNPLWGSVGQTQLRYVAGADYGDGVSTPPGENRPSAREVMSELLLASPGIGSSFSALFVAWCQLISIDIALTKDNASEPFHVPCDDGGGMSDVWCPSGAASDPIEFFRSEVGTVEDKAGNRVRSPINHATAFIDLDFMYGRTEEEAMSLRAFHGGFMNLTDEDLPFLNEDGTWKVPDQRTAKFPVTFALHVVLLREHNRCCTEEAPKWGYSGDEDLYYACRQWTTACVQHITEEDFVIRLLEGNVFTLGFDQIDLWKGLRNSSANSGRGHGQNSRALEVLGSSCYDEATNAGVDVFAVTAGSAAFESAVPTAVRVLKEGYEPADDDMIDLHDASKDLASFVKRNGIGPILRGAALSTSMGVDAHYSAVVSNLSPLFKLPVDAVQRGRDHGIPNYNDVREAYGLSRATSFSNVTAAEEVQVLLSNTYGGDIDLLDAFVGALAEGSAGSSDGFMGDLLQAAWLDQVFRAITGDRLYHNHSHDIEDVELVVLSDLIERTAGVNDLPLSVFVAPEISVCTETCNVTASTVVLADGFKLAWEVVEEDELHITLMARDIGTMGFMAIGFGGEDMKSAEDFIICELKGDQGTDCVDRQPVDSWVMPEPDFDKYKEAKLEVLGRNYIEETKWTDVKFKRVLSDLDDQDYDIRADIEDKKDTTIIYAYREGEGVDQHPNSNRGSAKVNFATGDSSQISETSNEFYSLHGALILLAWLVIMPVGLYYVRYRKGETVIFGNQWYEMHAECMVVAAEGVLPMAITAIVATGGSHTSPHAKWGIYMLGAVIAQLLTGWLRVKALEGTYSNFSTLHRVNKYFHVWSGRLAYVLGLVQCYRGLKLVEERETMVFSALELSFELGNFGAVYHYVFPVWGSVVLVLLIFLEGRKQVLKLKLKGVTSICGCLEFVNEDFAIEMAGERMIPRQEDLPLYTYEEFNDKVLNGQMWVIVDGAVINIGDFYQRHPGGSRLVTNAVGTDVTSELLGRDTSLGHVMSYSPHRHGERAWKIVRSLVIGYIDEEDEEALENSADDDELDVQVDGNEGDRRVGGNEEKEVGYGDRSEKAPDRRDSLRQKIGVPGTTLPISARVNFAPMNPMDWRIRRSGNLGTLPDPWALTREKTIEIPAASNTVFKASSAACSLPGATLPFANFASEPGLRGCQSEVTSPKVKAILERFHICPLLFRELMSSKAQKRSVYRYVFACPGAASVLAQSISGPCFFNLRATRGQSQGVVQRAYNGFAVRVHGAVSDIKRGSTAVDMVQKVVPASESREGQLCIEMRIRHYEDGAMSKILNNLAKDPDNPVVQLQGPFLIEKLIPPPAHRNVIMIGAGTGVNPMVQTIRTYQEIARSGKVANKSRLVLVWQATSKTDLFCADELAELQLKGNGLLEVLVLTSDEYRRRSVAGATFRRMKARLRTALSPVVSSLGTPSDSATPVQVSTPAHSSTGGRQGVDHGRGFLAHRSPLKLDEVDDRGNKKSSTEDSVGGPLSEVSQTGRVPASRDMVRAPTGQSSRQDGRHTAKDSMDARRRQAVAALQGEEDDSGQGDDSGRGDDSGQGLPEIVRGLTRKASLRISSWTIPSLNVVEETIPRPNVCMKAKLLDEQVLHGKVTMPVLKMAFGETLLSALDPHKSTNENSSSHGMDSSVSKSLWGEMSAMDSLCGSNIEPGKLQVIISGPTGFVFHVENVLADMGVPRRAIVMLD